MGTRIPQNDIIPQFDFLVDINSVRISLRQSFWDIEIHVKSYGKQPRRDSERKGTGLLGSITRATDFSSSPHWRG